MKWIKLAGVPVRLFVYVGMFLTIGILLPSHIKTDLPRFKAFVMGEDFE